MPVKVLKQPRKPRKENTEHMLAGKNLIKAGVIKIRESAVMPDHKVAVRKDSKTIVWRDKNKVA